MRAPIWMRIIGRACRCFLVDNNRPGVEMRKLDMLGRYCMGTYEVTLNDVRVPHDQLIGGENKGWDVLLSGLQTERITVAACDVGSAQGVVDLALNYAKERKQFGRPIGNFQSIAHMLADMQTEVEAGALADVSRGLDGRCRAQCHERDQHGEAVCVGGLCEGRQPRHADLWRKWLQHGLSDAAALSGLAHCHRGGRHTRRSCAT